MWTEMQWFASYVHELQFSLHLTTFRECSDEERYVDKQSLKQISTPNTDKNFGQL